MNIAVVPDFSSVAFFADRHSTYRVLREKFPFFRTKIDGEPCIVLSRYADVDDVLRHPLVTIQPSQRQPTFLESASTEDLHSASVAKSLIPCIDSVAPRFCQIIAQAFAPQAYAEMRGWMEEIIEHCLAELDDETETDFISTFVCPMIAELVGRLLHMPAVEAGKLLRRSNDLLAIICMGSPTNRAFEAPNELMRLYLTDIDDILRTLRNAKLAENDLIGLVLAAEDKANGMIHSESVLGIAGFIAAAYHTMRSTIANAILALLRHPDQKARLIAQPHLARSAWEEALRFDGPMHFLHRYARSPIVIGGVPIEPGFRLVLGIQSANRDELQFSNPDRFIIARPNSGHISLDEDPYFRWAAQLAGLGGELLMQRIFQRFPRMKVRGAQAAPACDTSWPMLTRLDLFLQ